MKHITARKRFRMEHQSRVDLPNEAAVLPDLILALSALLKFPSRKASLIEPSPELLRPLLLEPDGLPIRLCDSEPGTVIFEACRIVTFAWGAGRCDDMLDSTGE